MPPSLTKIVVDAAPTTESLIDSILSLNLQHGSLQTLCMSNPEMLAFPRARWIALVSETLFRGTIVALNRDVTTFPSQGATHVECLKATYVYHHQTEADFSSVCSTVAQLPGVESVTTSFLYLGALPEWAEDSFLEMVKASSSVLSQADLRTDTANSASSFKEQVVQYCVWNKVRSTMLGQAILSSEWPHVLSNIVRRSDGASLGYRLLGEKPDLMTRADVSRKRHLEDLSSQLKFPRQSVCITCKGKDRVQRK